jgi:hypothetical protein
MLDIERTYPRFHKQETCMACQDKFFYATGAHADKCQLKQASDSAVYCTACYMKIISGELTCFEAITGKKGHTF